jgi:hypothetical protein
LAASRQSPATNTDFPTSEPVPCNMILRVMRPSVTLKRAAAKVCFDTISPQLTKPFHALFRAFARLVENVAADSQNATWRGEFGIQFFAAHSYISGIATRPGG